VIDYKGILLCFIDRDMGNCATDKIGDVAAGEHVCRSVDCSNPACIPDCILTASYLTNVRKHYAYFKEELDEKKRQCLLVECREGKILCSVRSDWPLSIKGGVYDRYLEYNPDTQIYVIFVTQQPKEFVTCMAYKRTDF